MRDFRAWWALFVFFAVAGVLTVRYGYRRWQAVGRALRQLSGPDRLDQERRWRREGWRLACMAASLLSMTALVFAALLRGPPALLVVLRVVAVAAVFGVVALSLRR